MTSKIQIRMAIISGTVFAVCLSCAIGSPGAVASDAVAEEAFTKFQQKAADQEHKGQKLQALQTIEMALTQLQSLPPYSDKMSQLRVHKAELQLQTKQESLSLVTVKAIIADRDKVVAGAAADGELWLELGFLKDLISKYAQENDSIEGYELAHRLCSEYRQLRCRPRDTLQPLCECYIRHKNWVSLENSASQLLLVSADVLTQMTSLAMLQLGYEKQGKKGKASETAQKLQLLDAKTSVNERAWHRDMANVQKAVMNYDRALTEIDRAIKLDEKLTGNARDIQLAADLGTRAELELKLGRLELAVKDGSESDKIWTACSPGLWRSRSAISYSKCHQDALTTMEKAFNQLHRAKEAEMVRNRRRQLQYVR